MSKPKKRYNECSVFTNRDNLKIILKMLCHSTELSTLAKENNHLFNMTDNINNYCVILAGGKGRRLWPCSREKMPKQFLDFFGFGRTQLQQTYDRFSKFIPISNIFVNTNADYADIVRKQLPELPESNLMVEPTHRNTAPSAAWTTHRIAARNPEAGVIITPSDQAVQNEEAFERNMIDGLDFARKRDCLLSMGVKPTRPEPGYGYIQMGKRSEENVYKVQSFTEKPERDFAKVFIDSGEFLWNTGLFLATARRFRKALCKLLPPVFGHFDEQHPKGYTYEEENNFIISNFPSYPNLPLDYGILEKSDNVFVMQCDFGWADLGTWHSIYEAMHKGEGDNVVIDSDVMLDDSHDNVVKLPQGKFAVINGLDGYIVAEEGNVLLICKKEDSSALVRKFVNEVQMKKGEPFV